MFSLSTLILLSSQVYADVPSAGAVSQPFHQCHQQAKNYLDETTPASISSHCLPDTLASANYNAIKKSDDGQTAVFGYKNILIIQNSTLPLPASSPSPTATSLNISTKGVNASSGAMRIIAGKHSLFREVTALAIDSMNKDVIVLDGQHGWIFPFAITLFGNVAPRRAIPNKLLKGATDISVDPVNHEFVISNNFQKSIQVYSRLGDKDGHKPTSTTAPLRVIEGALTQISSAQSLGLDVPDSEIFLLDSGANQILIFDRAASGNVAPKRVIRGSGTLLSTPNALTYNPVKDSLEVINGDGSILSFPRVSSGEVVPAVLQSQ